MNGNLGADLWSTKTAFSGGLAIANAIAIAQIFRPVLSFPTFLISLLNCGVAVHVQKITLPLAQAQWHSLAAFVRAEERHANSKTHGTAEINADLTRLTVKRLP